jgi:peptidoglycan hydrolase-like protein with peptidoglycan-binding domain
VTQLQTYLATDPNIYPSGLITGYFGPLTQAAVESFQAANGIVSSGSPSTTGYGRVGPQTMAAINLHLGGGVSSGDSVPVLSQPTISTTGTSAAVTWSTNEPTTGQVYWDSAPLVYYEATGPRQSPYVSGTLTTDTNGMQLNHSVSISGLHPGTTYYFLARSFDSAGNMSMVLPMAFTTTP